jgi:hypothetical protein
MLAGLGPADRKQAWREIETELRPFERERWIRRPVPALDRYRTRLLISTTSGPHSRTLAHASSRNIL